MINLDQLRTLDAIERLGTFAAAARELGRATSAVSYAVKGLEEALGLSLFDRSGYRATLTLEGHRVLDLGRRALDQVAEVERLAQQLRGDWEPQFSLVVEGILPLAPILRALSRFGSEGTPTRVALRIEHLGGVRERFREEGADLMLAIDHEGDPHHESEPLTAIEMLLLCHAEHPLARATRVDRRLLAEHVELVIEDSIRHGASRTGRLSLGSPQTFRLPDFHSKRTALLLGVGFGWMPSHLVSADLEEGLLCEVAFIESSRYLFLPHLVRRRERPLGRAGQRILALLHEEWAGAPV